MNIYNTNIDDTKYTVTWTSPTESTPSTTSATTNKSVFEGYFDKTNSYDGKIDDSQQNDVGDCWLLSDAQSLQKTDFGAQAIKDAIDYKHAGTEIDPFELTIYNSFGEKQTIMVTRDDIKNYLGSDKSYSTGDGDTRILEAGIAKYFVQEIEAGRMKGRDKNDPLEGSPFGVYSANYMLTGKMPHGLTTVAIKPENTQYFDKLNNDNLNEVLNQYADNPKNMAMTVSFKDRNFWQKLFGSTTEEKQQSNHSYSITGINRDSSGEIVSISYTNPHDSSVEYTVSYDKFKKIVTQIDYLSGDS